MKYEIAESRQYPNHWHVEAVNGDGEVFVVVFSGPKAKDRAYEYAAWKNAVIAPAETYVPEPAAA